VATQLVVLVPGTLITLGTNSNTYAMTMKNLGAVYRESAKIDFGAQFSQEYHVHLQTKFGSAPTAGLTMRIWVGFSSSGTAATDNWANLTGADAAYSGYSGGTAAQSVLQLDFVGQLILDANTTQSGRVGSFVPKQRYGSIVWGNLSGQTTTNVDADHVLTLTPINARIEAAV
jgi:hypothetical protein